MSARRRLAAAAAAVVAASGLITSWGVVAHRDDPGVAVGFLLLSLWLGVSLAAVGALVVALRPGNRLGPVLVVGGSALVVEYLLREYAYRGLVAGAGWPLADVAGWAGLTLDPVFFPATLLLVLLLAPDGRPLSAGWSVVAVAVVAITAAQVLASAVRPGPLADPSYGYRLPWTGLLPAGTGPTIDRALDLATTVLVLLLAAGATSLVLRLRSADDGQRRRLAPLVVLVGVVAVALVLQPVPGAHDVGVALLVVGVGVGLPGALALSAARFGLWDIDRVVVASVVYACLATGVAVVYVAAGLVVLAVTGTSASGSAVPEVVTLIVLALVLGAARDRVTAAARRLVLGVRATPYEALAQLPQRLSATSAPDEVLPQVAGALVAGLGVPYARVRAVLADGTSREAAVGVPGADAELLVVAVRHLERVVGDVAVRPSPDRPLRAGERRLLTDLAAQAGPALQGVALTAQLRDRLAELGRQAEELRASRQREARAQLVERRRLERDLHDGAQQSLTAVARGLATASAAADRADALAALDAARRDLDAAIASLRELARGVYPPVLSAQGLAAALRAAARQSPSRVTVEGAGALTGVRFPPEVEVALYFGCLEALQNAARHAPDAAVTVSLAHADGALVVAVRDDGPGFDPDAAGDGAGTGLLGLRDRLGAVGGDVTVVAAPGAGTCVRLRVPVPATP